VGHSAAARRIRASNLFSASSARIRIITTAPNKAVKPSIVSGKGHRIEESMVDPEKEMLCP
jgi:hypothetical protein